MWWNLMIDSWDWLLIGRAHASAGTQYSSFTPLHRLWLQMKIEEQDGCTGWDITAAAGGSGDALFICIESERLKPFKLKVSWTKRFHALSWISLSLLLSLDFAPTSSLDLTLHCPRLYLSTDLWMWPPALALHVSPMECTHSSVLSSLLLITPLCSTLCCCFHPLWFPGSNKGFPTVPEAPRTPHELSPLWALVPGYRVYDVPPPVSSNNPPLRLGVPRSPLPSCACDVSVAPASASRCYGGWPLQQRPAPWF